MNQRLVFAICSLSLALSARAQYPNIPHDLEAKGDSVMKGYKELSDRAWEKALPAIERDQKNGKPYVPGASKASDLPQASIPAFPGAEGGGAYSFGGRGGRYMW
ncbi:hypothetical protein ACQ86N_23945 [Puia sp. P3]|uniref:hypothetical protein n=1 Tax=Puia sp. P3 TaxID=3423952 RepID=UPI003D666B47